MVMTRLPWSLAVLPALLVVGCSVLFPQPTTLDAGPVVAPPPPAPNARCLDDAPPPEAPVYAFFTCADAPDPAEPRPVPRDAHAADPVSRLEAAIIGLVGGPTQAEREAGYFSFFSEDTELAVNGVSIEADGTAIVDLGDIRFVSNAATSAGSEVLLAQLNATVFQVDAVTAVEYHIDGSCDAFWEWLQQECHVVVRP
jgi:Sporulation and spore germination